jgi:VWFA-related protein
VDETLALKDEHRALDILGRDVIYHREESPTTTAREISNSGLVATITVLYTNESMYLMNSMLVGLYVGRESVSNALVARGATIAEISFGSPEYSVIARKPILIGGRPWTVAVECRRAQPRPFWEPEPDTAPEEAEPPGASSPAGGEGYANTPQRAERGSKPDIAAAFQADVDLVNVDFTVRDAQGVLVRDVSNEDLRIFEDGVEQQAEYFSREDEDNVTMGLLLNGCVDPTEGVAVTRTFLRESMRDGDRALVVCLCFYMEEVCPLTSSKRDLDFSLVNLRKILNFSPVRIDVKTPNPVIQYPFNAAFRTIVERRLRGLGGRKAVVLIGDGVDSGSGFSAEEAVRSLQQANIRLYGLELEGSSSYWRKKGYENHVPQIASGTGGRVLRLADTSLDDAVREIGDELRTSYTLGYVSNNRSGKKGFRKIEIVSRNPDHVVHARAGYVAE